MTMTMTASTWVKAVIVMVTSHGQKLKTTSNFEF